MKNLPEKIQALVTKALELIRNKNPQWFSVCEKINVFINGRLRRCLGRARYARNEIELSGPYISTATDEDIFETITHEYAHHIAWRCYKCAGHGFQWKSVHRALGGKAKACVNAKEAGYIAVRNVIRRIIVVRNGTEYKVTPIRWNRHQRGFLLSGYTYVRTIEIDPNINSVKTIHESNPVGPRLSELIAAQRAS
jgi:predicted SprT family Zn-dependent metalloprotease